jgi:hypothetical protein
LTDSLHQKDIGVTGRPSAKVRDRSISHRPAARRLGRVAVRAEVELLENRITPTGNITITNALVVDASGQSLSAINVGAVVYIQADFTTQDLPADASYVVGYTVNGLTQDTGALSYGAGISGTGSYDANWGGFIATPGTNQVTVTVDPDHSVPETTYADNTMSVTFNAASPAVGNLSYTVAQIRAAYGLDNLPSFGSAAADGSGQTIALDEVGNDPTVLTDLDGFDEAMSLTTAATSQTLYQQYGPASGFVNVYNQSGTNITALIADSGSDGVPTADPTGGWEAETELDVEWAHAMAPGAKIDVIEVNDDANWATNAPPACLEYRWFPIAGTWMNGAGRPPTIHRHLLRRAVTRASPFSRVVMTTEPMLIRPRRAIRPLMPEATAIIPRPRRMWCLWAAPN